MGTPALHGTSSRFPAHSTPALNLGSPSWTEERRGDGTDVAGMSWDATPPPGKPTVLASPGPPMNALLSPQSEVHVKFSASGVEPAEDAHVYLLAKCYFDRGNLHACASLLESQPRLSDRTRFLQLYARLLMYEMHMEAPDELLPPLATADRATNEHGQRPLVAILEHLVDPRDPFLLFLKGVILRKLHKRVEAMDCLLSSVRSFPYNWSAWKELSRTLDLKRREREQILDLLPPSFMSVFFVEYSQRQSTQVDAEHMARLDTLQAHFPHSAYLLTSRAQSLYLHQDLEEAADTFQQALELQPYRLDGISEYSNALYVLDRAHALAQLVQQFAHVSHSADVWCMRGNFYNQRSEHFRAVESFKQALRLDQNCVAAWILLGHEYLELKNSQAAAEMYRRAIEINPHDYRPWHGLGQVYELNEAWSAAIDYYQHCALIRPDDARMWASLGVCYDRLGQNTQAIECFRRHLSCALTPLESVEAIGRMIELYEHEGDTVHSTLYHCLLAQVLDRELPHQDPALVARFAFSYVIAARWEMGELSGRLYRSKADKRLGRPSEPDAPRGDMARAQAYLQKVLMAGTDMTPVAEDLLLKLAQPRAAGRSPVYDAT